MQPLFHRIAEDARFQNFITFVILLAGVVVGIETSHAMVEQYGGPLHILNEVILWTFVVEVVVKVGAEGKRPWRYFMDGWNLFDFFIVAICFMPVHAEYVAVLRLARLLRVLKLVRALPKLQILVGALLKSIPSMGYVGLLLGMLFYVYGVAGVFLFGGNDPVHFRSLPVAMLSLFRVVTGDDWANIMYVQQYGCATYGYVDREHLCTASNATPVLAAGYFVSFVLVGAMVILNLFIGVITSGMEEAKAENGMLDRELKDAEGVKQSASDDVSRMLVKIGELQDELRVLEHRLKSEAEEGAEAEKA